MSAVKLAAICVAAMFVFDLILEGIIFMPLGVWEYPGGHFRIFPDTYHKFPLTEMLTAGAMFAAVAILRFFKNDRGETLADRGLESLKVSDRRKSVLRAFAMIGAINAIMFVCHNLPNTWTATRSAEWPADLRQSRRAGQHGSTATRAVRRRELGGLVALSAKRWRGLSASLPRRS